MKVTEYLTQFKETRGLPAGATQDVVWITGVLLGMARVNFDEAIAVARIIEEHAHDSTIKQLQPNTLEVGTTGHGEVIVNHPKLDVDANGHGHIIFSPEQAIDLASTLMSKARCAELEKKVLDR